MSEPVHTSETISAPSPGALDAAIKGARETTGIDIDYGRLGAALEPKSPEQPAPETPAEPKPTETVEHWKAMARKNEERARANAAAAQKLKEIEDRDLSDLERERRDREAAANENTTLKTELARLRVAVDKGLPAEIAATLSGANEEELAAHADRLLAWRGNLPPTTPRPDAGQGPRPTTPELEAQQDYLKFFPDEAPKAR